MEVPQKTKYRTIIWPSSPTPGHLSGVNHNLKRYIHPKVYSSRIYNSKNNLSAHLQRTGQRRCGKYRQWDISHKKEQNNAICIKMDGPRNYHTQWREISYGITFMWILKHDTNELIYKTETDSQTYKTNL